MKKRIISFFTALSLTLMLFTGIPISVSAVVGDLASDGYQLDDNGKLTIVSDTGMTNWKSVRSSNAQQVKSVVIQDGVTSIVANAFFKCTSLSSIEISNSVTSIGNLAFSNCTSLSSITIPSSVTSIGNDAFNTCRVLSSITIPSRVTSIGERAFAYCDSLSSITIPNSVTSIGTDAFFRCTSLDNIYVPCASVEHIKGQIDSNLHDIIQPTHNATQIAAKAATCAVEGNVAHWHCSQCDKNFTDNTCATEITDVTIPKTAHSYGSVWSYDDTNHYHECTVCGDQKDTAAHSGGTATCQTQATCSVCKQKYGSLGSHLYISWTKDGNQHWHVCIRCKETDTKVDHTWDDGTVTAATCTTQGTIKYTCTTCEYTKTQYTVTLGHKYDTTWTTDADQHWHACLNSGCTDKGDAANHTFVQKSDGTNHWQECSVCEYKKDETAHSWGNWTLTTEPTLNTTGTAERTCGCGENQTKTDVPALTDTTVWTKGDRTDPTVDAAGSQKYTSDYGDVTITIPQLSNTSVWTKTTTPATEEAEGSDVYTSTDYGTVTVTIPKKEHTHDWGDWSITANPTLTTTGTAERACTKDGTHTETKELPVLTDTTVWTITEHDEPTEEDTGKDVYTSEYGEVEVVLPKKEHTHDWGNWSITANPTLTATGTAERACTKDGTHTETKELPVLTDTTVWTITEHVDPTEEDTGKDVYTSEYGEVEVVLPKKEHTHVLVKTDAQAADCTTNGNEAYWTCSGCNKMFSNENGTREITAVPTIPATGHKFLTEWANNETYHWHVATCGHDVTSEAAAHTEDSGTVTIPPTTENDGVKTYACSVCGYVMRTATIPKLGEDHTHSFSPDWKHDSTSHWHECDCGEKNEIAPHIENGGVVTTAPTETSTGIMTYSCETCGYVMRTDVIPALIPEHNHTFGTDWKYDSVSHWHECECGEKSDISNHISSDWIVVTPATIDLEGIQIKRCTVCGIELDRETIEKLPNISTGDVAEDVRDTAGTNAGLVQDNTLIENVLTTDDKTEVTEGHSFEIVLEVTDIRDSVPASDVAAASSALRYNEKIGIYVDLSLFKIKDNSERTPIYNTSGHIGITLTVPDNIYASDRMYSIIRVHDGIAENLGGTYDKASRELTFYTDKFSTYAIAYAASNGGTDRPTVPDTPTNPSVPTYPNTPVVPVTPTVTETTVKKEEEVISDEPYVEDVSSAAGIYESGEADNNIHYVMILIFAAAAGIAAIATKKHFCKKNMK